MRLNKSSFRVSSACDRISGRPFLLALMAALGAACLCHAAETNRAPAEVVFPKSVFVDDPGGKDPFFPNRQRGQAVVQKPQQLSREPNWRALQLRGITGAGNQRFALINNLTFAKGEDGEVRVPNAKIKIRVLEIREKSVIILIDGLPDQKELILPDKVLPVE